MGIVSQLCSRGIFLGCPDEDTNFGAMTQCWEWCFSLGVLSKSLRAALWSSITALVGMGEICYIWICGRGH